MDVLPDPRLGFVDAGCMRIDHGRHDRTGVPEVVFAAGKTLEQTESALRLLRDRNGFALATRVSAGAGALLERQLGEGAVFHETARVLQWGRLAPTDRCVGVLCAGTSDLPVAEEAAVTLEAFGNAVLRRNDVGVAGVERLLSDFDEVRNTCHALIVVAGMEGALPSVVAGLARSPVIAVPTSVGYGAALGGITALLGMLTSCAPGIGVVNIDNGFGAAALAHKIVTQSCA